MHYHLHDETGMCYGDLDRFEDAACHAAEHVWPRVHNYPDLEEQPGILTVIEADICIQEGVYCERTHSVRSPRLPSGAGDGLR